MVEIRRSKKLWIEHPVASRDAAIGERLQRLLDRHPWTSPDLLLPLVNRKAVGPQPDTSEQGKLFESFLKEWELCT